MRDKNIKILQRKQNLLRLTAGMGGGGWVVLKLTVGKCLRPQSGNLPEQDGMFEPKLVAGCGTKKAYDRPSPDETAYKLIHSLEDRIT